MTQELARVDDGNMVGADTLAYLGLDPRKPEVHALVLLCQRYRLDPLLGHASIIAAKGGNKAYITRDGMLEVAHRSGQLDGIVVDEQRESDHGYSATVSVWRKDMSHPFTYKGGCGVDETQAKVGNGAEMALARAERRALRRAFAIPAYDDADEPNLDQPDVETGEISQPAGSPDINHGPDPEPDRVAPGGKGEPVAAALGTAPPATVGTQPEQAAQRRPNPPRAAVTPETPLGPVTDRSPAAPHKRREPMFDENGKPYWP